VQEPFRERPESDDIRHCRPGRVTSDSHSVRVTPKLGDFGLDPLQALNAYRMPWLPDVFGGFRAPLGVRKESEIRKESEMRKESEES
jgi:hypothetical protein